MYKSGLLSLLAVSLQLCSVANAACSYNLVVRDGDNCDGNQVAKQTAAVDQCVNIQNYIFYSILVQCSGGATCCKGNKATVHYDGVGQPGCANEGITEKFDRQYCIHGGQTYDSLNVGRVEASTFSKGDDSPYVHNE